MSGWDDNDNESAILAERKKRQEEFENGGGNLPKIVRAKFGEGKHQIRCVSEPLFRMVHWIPAVSRQVVCPKTDNKDAECLVCKAGNKVRVAYFANIIDRADGVVKVWGFSRTLKEQIAAYKDAFGSPLMYDLILLRKGLKMEDTRWIVTPFNKGQETPLTAAEQELVKNAIDLSKLFKITDATKVASYLQGKLPPKPAAKSATPGKAQDAAPSAPAEPAAEEDSGDDTPF